MLITELKRKNRRLYENFVDWLENLIWREDPKHSHGKERDELVQLALEENGWDVWDVEELDAELSIGPKGVDRLELDFKIIRNQVCVCFKGIICIEMTWSEFDIDGNSVQKIKRLTLYLDLDVDFKIKVFNSFRGGEILEDMYLELFTRSE